MKVYHSINKKDMDMTFNVKLPLILFRLIPVIRMVWIAYIEEIKVLLDVALKLQVKVLCHKVVTL